MICKQVDSLADALSGVTDGATVMIGGFGGAGQPNELIDALIAQGAKDLVIVNNNAGNGALPGRSMTVMSHPLGRSNPSILCSIIAH